MNDFGFRVASFREPNLSHVHKFGSNPALNNSTFETVWSAGGLYPWASLSSAQTIYCISTGADTGDLKVEGLDANYNLQTETKTLTGTSAVTLDNTFLRIFRMQYISTSDNAGTITARVTSGTGTVVAQIDAGLNQTLMCVYTVPTHCSAFLMDYTASCEKGADAEVRLLTREPSGSFQIKNEVQVYETTSSKEFPVPLYFPSKTDIDVRAMTSNAGGNAVIFDFDLILEER